jgi:methionine-S-sulfoxide reductase
MLNLLLSVFISQTSFATSPPVQGIAVFAGGCFWCMEPPYEKLDGVISVTSGFSGGDKANPSYKEVAGKKTKHVEAVKVVYDPKKVTYKKLLEVYWKQINPTDIGGQFVDRGAPYKPVIFYMNEKEKKAAEESKALLEKSKRFKKPIV